MLRNHVLALRIIVSWTTLREVGAGSQSWLSPLLFILVTTIFLAIIRQVVQLSPDNAPHLSECSLKCSGIFQLGRSQLHGSGLLFQKTGPDSWRAPYSSAFQQAYSSISCSTCWPNSTGAVQAWSRAQPSNVYPSRLGASGGRRYGDIKYEKFSQHMKKLLQHWKNYVILPRHYAWECGFSARCPWKIGLAENMKPPEE